MDILNKLSTWMGSGASVLVYAAIVLLFLIGVCKCILPVSHNRKKLKNAIRQIKQGDKARRSWQEERFLGKGSLYPHWSEYLNNLFFADGEYHNPASVEDYINEETVIDGPGSSKLSEALPGVLVSLGFLGTLLGLSQALSEMNSVDAQTITASMNTLLSSMKYAFLTSIFGVVASIAFQLLTKITHGRTENELRSFYNAMARHAGVLSVDPMTQVAIYQQEQTEMLKRLTEALAAEKLKTLLEPITQTAEMTAERQKVLMEGVADAYIDKMNMALHGQLENLASTIETTCRAQEKITRNVLDALGDLTAAANAMHDIKNDATAVLEQLGRLYNRLSGLMDQYENVNSGNTAVLNRQSETLESMNALCLQLSGEMQKVSETAASFLRSGDRLSRSAAESLTEAGKELGTVMADARGKLTKDMDESLDYFEDCMTKILKRVDKALKAVQTATESLQEQAAAGRGGK